MRRAGYEASCRLFPPPLCPSKITNMTMDWDSSVFDLTDHVAVFLHLRFAWYLADCPRPPGPLPPLEFSVPLVTDIEQLARRAAEAYRRHCK